jgi:hypothetical protein
MAEPQVVPKVSEGVATAPVDEPVERIVEIPSPPKSEGIAASLKTELALIALLVTFIGLVATESYYGHFGIRYQFLNLGPIHILYRGLTLIPAAPYVIVLYLSAFIWLTCDAWLGQQNTRFSLVARSPIAYAFVLLILLIGYPLVRYAGIHQAEKDANASTSTLPEIMHLKTPTEEIRFPDQVYRLLVIDNDFVIVFHPLSPNDRSAEVTLRRFRKGDVVLLETD